MPSSSALFFKKYCLKTILNEQHLTLTIQRLCRQIVERHLDLQDTVLIGMQPRGIFVSDRMLLQLQKQLPDTQIQYGKLDITFYRDDVRKQLHIPNHTTIPFPIENKNVILIDRRFSRQLPIQPDYTGKSIDSFESQKVKVLWKERDGREEVVLM